jgi:UDP-N-acetylglucosamine 2-epimerase (non-hydrolysing)/GDP/UDP-N,N'-diacetylbacillosamine 2-epimerase (hydrolysing)
MKRKITVTTGSRADYGILRPVLREIISSKKLELYLIVTGMHLSKKHGFTVNEIKNDGFKIYTSFKMIPQDSTFSMAHTLGKGIVSFAKIFKNLKPDINLVLGDRDEMLASAIAAYHMNIPNAHIHGGDKTQGGIDEYNRHAITKISNIHFAATPISKERIIKMGENPKHVFLTGSPSVDEILDNKITTKNNLEKKLALHFTGKEILLVYHPVTTQSEQSGKQIINILNAIITTKRPTIAIAPNSDVGNKMIFKYLELYSKKYHSFRMYRSVPRSDYLGLLKNCGVLVGNSSSGIIEASYFNIPVVNIGIRQKDREKGKNVLEVTDYSTKLIHKMILKALQMKQKNLLRKELIYGAGNASKKIVKYLERITLDKKLIQKQIYY